MNIKVVYHSSTGNTKKLAGAISKAVDTRAEATKEATNFTEVVDLLFIGDGIYFGKPKKCTMDFISKLDPATVRNVAVFASCGGQTKVGEDIKKLLTDRGLNVVCDPFICKGQSWIFMNRKHPDGADLEKASRFAKDAVSKTKI